MYSWFATELENVRIKKKQIINKWKNKISRALRQLLKYTDVINGCTFLSPNLCSFFFFSKCTIVTRENELKDFSPLSTFTPFCFSSLSASSSSPSKSLQAVLNQWASSQLTFHFSSPLVYSQLIILLL